jgi:hypothetical protein
MPWDFGDLNRSSGSTTWRQSSTYLYDIRIHSPDGLLDTVNSPSRALFPLFILVIICPELAALQGEHAEAPEVSVSDDGRIQQAFPDR